MIGLSYHIMRAALLCSLPLTHFHCYHRMYSTSNTLAPPQLRRDVLSSEKGDQRQRFVSHKVRSLVAYSSHSCCNKHTMMRMMLHITTLQQHNTTVHSLFSSALGGHILPSGPSEAAEQSLPQQAGDMRGLGSGSCHQDG